MKISVQDTGTGIPPKYIKRIFDPFFSTKQEGSGLGLATSYSIVRRHGGIITVASNPDQGSRFDVYLPATGKKGAEKTKTQEPDFKGCGTILIMDDELLIRDMLGQMLGSMGFDVIETCNGEQALAEFSKQHNQGNPLQAVILDLTIPGAMGGKETIQKIRDMDMDIPVFVVSGYSDDDALASPESFGFTASLEKPFLSADLKKIFRQHLEPA